MEKEKHFNFQAGKFKEAAVAEKKMKLTRNKILEQREGNFTLF
jgi:hypothetical protein